MPEVLLRDTPFLFFKQFFLQNRPDSWLISEGKNLSLKLLNFCIFWPILAYSARIELLLFKTLKIDLISYLKISLVKIGLALRN